MNKFDFKKMIKLYCKKNHYSNNVCLACINLYNKVINNDLNKIDRLMYYKIISSQSNLFKRFHYYTFEREIFEELECNNKFENLK